MWMCHWMRTLLPHFHSSLTFLIIFLAISVLLWCGSCTRIILLHWILVCSLCWSMCCWIVTTDNCKLGSTHELIIVFLYGWDTPVNVIIVTTPKPHPPGSPSLFRHEPTQEIHRTNLVDKTIAMCCEMNTVIVNVMQNKEISILVGSGTNCTWESLATSQQLSKCLGSVWEVFKSRAQSLWNS